MLILAFEVWPLSSWHSFTWTVPAAWCKEDPTVFCCFCMWPLLFLSRTGWCHCKCGDAEGNQNLRPSFSSANRNKGMLLCANLYWILVCYCVQLCNEFLFNKACCWCVKKQVRNRVDCQHSKKKIKTQKWLTVCLLQFAWKRGSTSKVCSMHCIVYWKVSFCVFWSYYWYVWFLYDYLCGFVLLLFCCCFFHFYKTIRPGYKWI